VEVEKQEEVDCGFHVLWNALVLVSGNDPFERVFKDLMEKEFSKHIRHFSSSRY